MKKLASVVVGLIAAAAPANAADMPVKAPVMAPVYSWTGLYFGLGAGLLSSRNQATTGTVQVGPLVFNASPLINSDSLNNAAFRGSGYLGFNWQVAPKWVIGLEGDVGFADRTTTFEGFFAPGAENGDSADSFSIRTTWDASARARAGFLLTPATLIYATGGAAWQHYEVSSTCASTGNITLPKVGFGNCSSLSPATLTDAVTRPGWTAGAGFETAFWGNWIARGEYRYADFGIGTTTFTRSSTIPAANPFSQTVEVKSHEHLLTIGLAYKVGDPVAASNNGGARAPYPVKAPPPAMMSWSGAYLGLAGGPRVSEARATTTALTAVTGFVFTPLGAAGMATSQQINGIAGRGEVYAGINWQVMQWVLGLEDDFGFADQTTTLLGYQFSPAAGGVFGGNSTFAMQTTWDASARVRIGYLVSPTLLVYVTGGAAWQRFSVTSTDGNPAELPQVIVNSADKVGPTVGAGLETSLSKNWFARAAYRYADFGTATFTLARTGAAFLKSETDTFDVRLRSHTATFGVAYKVD